MDRLKKAAKDKMQRPTDDLGRMEEVILEPSVVMLDPLQITDRLAPLRVSGAVQDGSTDSEDAESRGTGCTPDLPAGVSSSQMTYWTPSRLLNLPPSTHEAVSQPVFPGFHEGDRSLRGAHLEAGSTSGALGLDCVLPPMANLVQEPTSGSDQEDPGRRMTIKDTISPESHQVSRRGPPFQGPLPNESLSASMLQAWKQEIVCEVTESVKSAFSQGPFPGIEASPGYSEGSVSRASSDGFDLSIQRELGGMWTYPTPDWDIDQDWNLGVNLEQQINKIVDVSFEAKLQMHSFQTKLRTLSPQLGTPCMNDVGERRPRRCSSYNSQEDFTCDQCNKKLRRHCDLKYAWQLLTVDRLTDGVGGT